LPVAVNREAVPRKIDGAAAKRDGPVDEVVGEGGVEGSRGVGVVDQVREGVGKRQVASFKTFIIVVRST